MPTFLDVFVTSSPVLTPDLCQSFCITYISRHWI